MIGHNAGPAQWPNTSRLVEAICVKLCQIYTSPTKSPSGSSVSRWTREAADYGKIRELVVNNDSLMQRTGIQLFSINQHTLGEL